MDGMEPEPVLGDQDERMQNSNQLSQELQESFEQTEQVELPQDVHPYLGKLEQCPESIEEPEEEDGLILYQTVEDVSMENSIEPGTLMGDASGDFLQARENAENSREDGSLEHTDLADQVDEISEGKVDQISLFQCCNEMTEKAVKQLDSKPSEMELHSFYSNCTQHSCPSTSLSSPAVASKSDETTVKSSNGAGVRTEVSMDQENLKGIVEDCKDRALTLSLQDNKDNLLKQNEIKFAPTLSANSNDTKPSDLKFSILPDSGGEKKPGQLELPIKVEETKTEIAEETLRTYPDSSEVKHAKFLAYAVKSEDLETKSEQLDFKQEILETKPEDLSLPMKAESFDSKPEILHFTAYSDGTEIKPEAKPVILETETKPEGLRLTGFHDMSAVKPEAKTENLEFATYPDSSEIKTEGLEFTALHEIKAETKQELLEADSTVLTPKLEQADALMETSESLAVKGQVKEERPSSPGENTQINNVNHRLKKGKKSTPFLRNKLMLVL